MSRPLAAGVLGFVIVGVAACGSPGSSGSELEQGGSSEVASPSSSSAEPVDPCQAVASGDAAQLGVEGSGEAENLSSSRTCTWKISTGGVFSVTADDKYSVDELNLSNGRVEEASLGGMATKIIRESVGPGDCAVVFDSSPSSSIQIDVVVPRDTEAACQLAQKATPLVAKNLVND
ncbi:DUF3558 family protein [Saccharopolyspora sp. NPDC000359]|uniref:DUF3558 family protein n=1 Tax=Saccharopolyspora sp. NPDC000359 TaxID=3154251 RepID=UPI003328B40C